MKTVIMLVLLISLSFGNSKRLVYAWYAKAENIRLLDYSICIRNEAQALCEIKKNEQKELLKIEPQKRLAKVKRGGGMATDSNVAERQRKRFYFRECLKFARTDSHLLNCYDIYDGKMIIEQSDDIISFDTEYTLDFDKLNKNLSNIEGIRLGAGSQNIKNLDVIYLSHNFEATIPTIPSFQFALDTNITSSFGSTCVFAS